MKQSALHMVALMPPPELTRQIERIRHEFAASYHCKAALKPPVHITLYPPFRTKEESENLLACTLSLCCSRQPEFPVQIKNFGAFRRNGVIFITVALSEALVNLQRDMAGELNKLLTADIGTHQSYHPHITIGYRDIPAHVFPDAVMVYEGKSFEGSFQVEEVCLWKHTGILWETIERFPLSGKRMPSVTSSNS
jgi:2'-5' RNA ligase